jgi:hypothetical protein
MQLFDLVVEIANPILLNAPLKVCKVECAGCLNL